MGKYIKKFDTHSDYEDFIETEDFIKPNVSYCVDNKDVHYNSTQTLFALEIESGKFISFYFQSGTLYANTDDGSSALWVCDGSGVVVDNISYPLNERAPILEQINGHYGTSFTGWSDNEIGLRYGDPVPNWNAYEKIEIPAQKIAVKIPGGGNTGLMCGTLSNKVFDMLTNGNGCLVASVNGIVQNYDGPGIGASDYIIGLLSNYNLEATEVVQTIVTYEVGAEIPQWEQYEQYK